MNAETKDIQSLGWFSPDQAADLVGCLESLLAGILKSFVLVVCIFILCVFVLCMSGHHMHAQCPQRPEEGVGFPGEGVIGGC